jgi:membrane protein implicated in regulation of membrane protease activity
MTDTINAVLSFIGSKWFTLVLMVLMGVFLPTTWGNLQIVLAKNQLSSFWWIGVVFACNVLGVAFAFWKFMSQISNKQQISQTNQQW